jgi:hypothetical protein
MYCLIGTAPAAAHIQKMYSHFVMSLTYIHSYPVYIWTGSADCYDQGRTNRGPVSAGFRFEVGPGSMQFVRDINSKYCKYNCSVHLLAQKFSHSFTSNALLYFALCFIYGSSKSFVRVKGCSKIVRKNSVSQCVGARTLPFKRDVYMVTA